MSTENPQVYLYYKMYKLLMRDENLALASTKDNFVLSANQIYVEVYM